MLTDDECPTPVTYLYWYLTDGQCVLLKQWKVINIHDYIASSVILLLICLLREYIIYLTQYYGIRALTGRYVPFWPTLNELDDLMDINCSPLLTKSVIPREHWRNPITLKIRIIDCGLYGLSLSIGYALMLIIMSFNMVFIIVIVFGYCLGRLIFYSKSKLLMRFAVRFESTFILSDHCRVRS